MEPESRIKSSRPLLEVVLVIIEPVPVRGTVSNISRNVEGERGDETRKTPAILCLLSSIGVEV